MVAIGAGGGSGLVAGDDGGQGRHPEGSISVTPGETLTVIVGGQGGDSFRSDPPVPGGGGGGGSGGGGGLAPAGGTTIVGANAGDGSLVISFS